MKPSSWEARTTLYIAYLIEQGKQSASIKSYVSAIKKLLVIDGYITGEIMRCYWHLSPGHVDLINDRVHHRLPIFCSFMEMILFEIERAFGKNSQFYLETMYKAIFLLSYYGMMRIGEVTASPHVLKAKNVHLATNKDKLLVLLYSSKTHNEGQRPQKIKITSNRSDKTGQYLRRHFCPFKTLRQFIAMRGNYLSETEPFFIFRDRQAVKPAQANLVLKNMIHNLGLEDKYYSMHSFRIGRTSDLIKFGCPIDEVQRMGCWRSNAVFRYIRN